MQAADSGSERKSAPLAVFSGSLDGIIARLDADGNLLWHRYIGTAGSEDLGEIVADGTGNYMIAGKSVSDIPNAGTVVVANTDPGTDQMFAVWIDSDGTPLRQSHFGGAGGESGRQAAKFSGGYLIGGTGSGTFNTAFNQERNAFSGGGAFNDYTIVAIDANGNHLWHTFQGATGTNDDLVFLSGRLDGRILAGGSSTNSWGAPTSPHPDPGAQPAMTIFTLDAAGGLAWNGFYGNAGVAGSALGNAFERNLNDEILFAGAASASFGVPLLPHQGSNDFVVGAVDASTGALKRHSFFGGAATNELMLPTAFMQSCDNGLFLSGVSDGNFGDPLVPYFGVGARGYHLKLSPGEGGI